MLTECAYACTNPFRSEKRLASRILAVRKGEYKLVINFALGTDELYDLSSDPREELSSARGNSGRRTKKFIGMCAEARS